jgi:hypothetical protein
MARAVHGGESGRTVTVTTRGNVMTTSPTRFAIATITAGLGVTTWLAAPANAADPPASWDNERILDCGGTTVRAYLTPAGFGGAFHVVGSTDIIKPKHVEVVFPGTTESVTTFDTPGFDRNARGVVVCGYTDPDELVVSFVGVRT